MSAADRRPPFYLGIDLGGTNIKSGVVDDRRAGPLVGQPGDRGGARSGGRGWTIWPRRAVAPSRPAGSPGTTSRPSGWARRGRWTSRRGCSSTRPTSPAGTNLPIRQLPRRSPGQAHGAPERRQRRGLRRVLGGRGRDTREPGAVHARHRHRRRDHRSTGRILEGRHSHGAECGHIIIQMENGRQCSCGAFGHLEAYASATALVKRAEEALERGEIVGAARGAGRRRPDRPRDRPRPPTRATRSPAA